MQTLKDLITTSFAFANMADDEKNKMIEELSGIAIQRTVIRALDKMNEDEVKDWQKTIEIIQLILKIEIKKFKYPC